MFLVILTYFNTEYNHIVVYHIAKDGHMNTQTHKHRIVL